MFDGVFDPRWEDWQRAAPRAPPSAPWPLIAILVVLAMLSIVAAVAYPEAFASGLEQY